MSSLNPPGGGKKPDPNATVGDAITYVSANPSGLVAAIKYIVGFFAALFKPGAPKIPKP